jgi:hypothetical protein
MLAPFRTALFPIAVLSVAAGCVTSRAHSGLTAAIPVFSQDAVSRDSTGRRLAAVAGVVLDSSSGAGVEGAQVVLRSSNVPKPLFAYTDKRGGFVIGKLEPGTYNILVRRLAFLPFVGRRDLRAGVVDTLRVRIGVSAACLCP